MIPNLYWPDRITNKELEENKSWKNVEHATGSDTADATKPQRKRMTERRLETKAGEGNVDSGLHA